MDVVRQLKYCKILTDPGILALHEMPAWPIAFCTSTGTTGDKSVTVKLIRTIVFKAMKMMLMMLMMSWPGSAGLAGRRVF